MRPVGRAALEIRMPRVAPKVSDGKLIVAVEDLHRMGGMHGTHILPVDLLQIELVAVELEDILLHGLEAAVQPFARDELDPVETVFGRLGWRPGSNRVRACGSAGRGAEHKQDEQHKAGA